MPLLSFYGCGRSVSALVVSDYSIELCLVCKRSLIENPYAVPILILYLTFENNFKLSKWMRLWHAFVDDAPHISCLLQSFVTLPGCHRWSVRASLKHTL